MIFRDIEVGLSQTNRLCISCHFINGTLSKGCLLHVAINESVDTVSLLSELNNNNDEETSEWVCTPYTISEQDSSYGITVFEIEMDQTTTKVIPIDRINLQ